MSDTPPKRVCIECGKEIITVVLVYTDDSDTPTERAQCIKCLGGIMAVVEQFQKRTDVQDLGEI